MIDEIVASFCCPRCQGPLGLEGPGSAEGALVCACGMRVPVVRGVPRFASTDDYTGSFSFEWNRFATTQLDGDGPRGRRRRSEERLQQSLDVPLSDLAGKTVLDAGCGMGRFAEVAARHGATVVAVDLSYSVESAARNLSAFPRCAVAQADLRSLPLRPESFDLIYSLGVLHHTPDPRRSFEALLPFLKPGGKISITLYSGYNRVYVASTTAWRRLTTRLPHRWVYRLSHLAIPLYHLYRVPVIGALGTAVWPISLDPDPAWRVLDTFDCYTPRYQFYFTHPTVFSWFKEAGLTDVTVLEPGISFIATRPAAATRGRAEGAAAGTGAR